MLLSSSHITITINNEYVEGQSGTFPESGEILHCAGLLDRIVSLVWFGVPVLIYCIPQDEANGNTRASPKLLAHRNLIPPSLYYYIILDSEFTRKRKCYVDSSFSGTTTTELSNPYSHK